MQRKKSKIQYFVQKIFDIRKPKAKLLGLLYGVSLRMIVCNITNASLRVFSIGVCFPPSLQDQLLAQSLLLKSVYVVFLNL